MIAGCSGQPEVIVDASYIDAEGDTISLSTKTMIVDVTVIAGRSCDGTLALDIPNFRKNGENMVLRLSLQQLQEAIIAAALNRS